LGALFADPAPVHTKRKLVINHHLLGLHHVNETVARAYWIYWDVGFLAWGAAMLIGGWTLLRQGRREEIAQAVPNRAEPRRAG
jgi:uncharacterized membrane protein